MKCPKCGYENHDYAQFCGKCGARLVQETLENKKKNQRINKKLAVAITAAVLVFGGAGGYWYYSAHRNMNKTDALDSTLKEGYEYLENKDYTKADECFEKAVKISPKSVKAKQAQAISAKEQGDEVRVQEIVKEVKEVSNETINLDFNYTEYYKINISEVADTPESDAKTDKTENKEPAAKEDDSPVTAKENETLPVTLTYRILGDEGWQEVLLLEEDGTFEGQYSELQSDSGMDQMLVSTYTGKMKDIKKISDHSWSMIVDTVNYDKSDGESWVEDGTNYMFIEDSVIMPDRELILYDTKTNDQPASVKKKYEKDLKGHDKNKIDVYSLYLKNKDWVFFEVTDEDLEEDSETPIESEKDNEPSNKKSETEQKDNTTEEDDKGYTVIKKLSENFEDTPFPIGDSGFLVYENGGYSILLNDGKYYEDEPYPYATFQSFSTPSKDPEDLFIQLWGNKEDNLDILTREPSSQWEHNQSAGGGNPPMNVIYDKKNKKPVYLGTDRKTLIDAGIEMMILRAYESVGANASWQSGKYQDLTDEYYVYLVNEEKAYGPYEKEDPAAFAAHFINPDYLEGSMIFVSDYDLSPTVSGLYKTYSDDGKVVIRSAQDSTATLEQLSDGSFIEKAEPVSYGQMVVQSKDKKALVGKDMEILFEGEVDAIAGKAGDTFLIKKDGQWMLVKDAK